MLRGKIVLARLQRLKKLVLPVKDKPDSDLGYVDAQLQFALSEQGRAVITGQVAVKAQVECQRCLQPMELPINCELHLQLVKDDEAAKQLLEPWEPLNFAGGELSLTQLIEDEILVALPAVCRHDSAECQQLVGSSEPAEPSNQLDNSKSNPFQLLSGLKKTGD